ncbi:DUF1178 family protein [Phaeovibrio sulfidiphilus]|uniref:DUF1178 family protein n=1 Tax=Phaeovibrio sulfidiphilus TaxID=1220600 RepID=A0A8J7CQ83_9PROT|nr:DUF1178 family protein [Phaeovibrio sulfidiphilus]MBE1237952.1 DUF1178 family protein [Phaeovibrio sulfidiphilus]
MIRYTLICERDHEFEAWFQNSASCDEQLGRGLVSCPFCDSAQVSKALMTPSVVSSRSREARASHPGPAPDSAPGPSATGGSSGRAPEAPAAAGSSGALEQRMQDLARVIKEIRTQVEANCENVGERFASEARQIHYGEREARPIYGQATATEASELADEGIAFAVLPWSAGPRN